nr:glycosyl transferase, family 8 [Tanacetum cinerariifolium]
MAKTMEQYMSKTRADYGSRVARPKIKDKDNFELKGQFFKELRDNTFSGSDHEDSNEHIEKVLEIVDLFHIPNITIDQYSTISWMATLASSVVFDDMAPLESRILDTAYWEDPIRRIGYESASIIVEIDLTWSLGLDLVELELRRDQVDDLLPTIKEGEVVEEFKARNDARMVSKFFGYPNDCDHDKKICIDCAYNLKFSCMIVLEDMDGYRDEGMGKVIFGEPFLRVVEINAQRFNGMITIHNGNEEVTYQMVRSHPSFKHHTNEQCNKIPPLLKVSEEDKMNGILHSYEKLKSFYKEVLNLGPKYVRDAKMEEWLTRRHISVHEIE